MAKQTFTTGQVLTAAQMTSLQQTAMGGGSATAKTASYVLTAADAGTTVIMNSGSSTTITVNTGLFAAGDTVFIVNQGAGVCTITAGTATVSTAGSLTMSQNETGQLYFLSASAAIFSEYTQSASTPAFVGVSAYNSATQSIANDTFTARNYNTENFDTNTFHDNATNNTRFTIPTNYGGKYLITAATRFATNSSGRRIVAPRKNGSTYIANTQEIGATSISAAEPTIVMTSIVELVAGDYVELMVYQNSGGALNIAGTTDQSTFSMQFLGA